MTQEITVLARIVAKKETIDQVRAECLRLIEPTRNEPGCQSYVLHQALDNPATFVFVEKWKNREELEKHNNSDHLKAFVQALDGQTDELVIEVGTLKQV